MESLPRDGSSAGAGADTFGFSPGDGQDWTDGFTRDVDKLQFAGGLTPGGSGVQATRLLGGRAGRRSTIPAPSSRPSRPVSPRSGRTT